MSRKVTVQDIADALGISRNTVSKALNNSGGLAEPTRERILQMAVEMGYKQFSYLKPLIGINAIEKGDGFRGEIAVLTTQFLGPSHFGSVALDRFQQGLALAGYTLNTHRVLKENIADMSLPITFMKERVCGIVCIEMFNRAYDEMVCALGLPTLFIDGPSRSSGKSLPCDMIIMENTVGITRLVRNMLRRGIRRIGFIGDWDHCQSFYERYAAFRMAMIRADIPVEEHFLIRTNEKEKLEASLSTLTALPELFLCANDFVAMDAMQILKKRGCRIPEDVMFCGFDDSPESRALSLTTVHISAQIIAFSAAQLLLARIRDPSLACRTVYTETYLIERESTEGTVQ